jgi:hypothetical protein
MPANTQPIFTRTPQLESASTGATPVVGTVANSSLVLASSTLASDCFVVFTADATNGSYCQKIRFKAGVSAVATTATVARVFLNNGSAPATATSNVFLDDITLPAVTPSITLGSAIYELSINLAIPAGSRLLVAFATASANGWQVIGVGGKY